MVRFARVTVFLLAVLLAPSAHSQWAPLKSGDSIELSAVYWISNCRSLLSDFGNVEILEGPPGIEISIRKEPVMATRQGCADKVPGGMVVLKATKVDANWSGVVKYRVNYKTYDGNRQSSHEVRLSLVAN